MSKKKKDRWWRLWHAAWRDIGVAAYQARGGAGHAQLKGFLDGMIETIEKTKGMPCPCGAVTAPHLTIAAQDSGRKPVVGRACDLCRPAPTGGEKLARRLLLSSHGNPAR